MHQETIVSIKELFFAVGVEAILAREPAGLDFQHFERFPTRSASRTFTHLSPQILSISMGIDALQMCDLENLPTKNQTTDLVDVECQPHDSGSLTKALAPAPPSFNKWLAEALLREEAASKIQLFLRYRFKLRASANASMQRTASTASSLDSPGLPEVLNEDHLQYEILLWYGSSLGSVGFISCDITEYPCVEVAEGNESLPGIWNLREGDFLISINERSTKQPDEEASADVFVNADGPTEKSRTARAVAELHYLARRGRSTRDQLEAREGQVLSGGDGHEQVRRGGAGQ
ncbi:unnamed protein product [Phytophthora fragariaefolia]|uniref:Unnamed protein product n=1 Tax=Phytophthora fragariaefolia TaxID=1490495 RepID=A0A9W6X5D4_9STRA|nr:unnamed protein product [Phytophthora fragariaefolia]